MRAEDWNAEPTVPSLAPHMHRWTVLLRSTFKRLQGQSPLGWLKQSKHLLPTVTATTVKVYDDVFPLKMTAPSDKKTEKFENFVEAVFDPLTRSEAPEPGRPKKAKAMSATGAFTLLVRLPGLNALQAVEECLEDKRDGRRKGRLVLQGFKEPAEWDVESNEAPSTSAWHSFRPVKGGKEYVFQLRGPSWRQTQRLTSVA